MIAKLSGRLVSAELTSLILDVQGLPYSRNRPNSVANRPAWRYGYAITDLVREDHLPFTVLRTQRAVVPHVTDCSGLRRPPSILTTLPRQTNYHGDLGGDKAIVSGLAVIRAAAHY